ncbi:MAG TPA: alkaline phosphatase D family protein, partial [Nannocystaceae bacterium]|nr:alkaline phosphatase D family protein [Nannocystaceae bacterium]
MQFLRRRQFLRATLATVSGWTLGCADAGEPAIDTGNAQDGHELFPQSVASGDPRSESLILWTRVEIPDVEDEDVELYLELFADEELTQAAMWEEGPLQALVATAKHDHCVKVRVVGLEPATVYYYRFVAQVGDDLFASRTGRTKTAPAKDADTPVKFAFVSCQDFGGRWFNGYAQLVTKDPDFFVHLGDYIYETAGDSGFQGGTEGREVVFEDSGNVLVVDPNGDGGYQAARSLANYRQLYRIHRSDPALQRVHERLPMIATWDDHEFADDCWG